MPQPIVCEIILSFSGDEVTTIVPIDEEVEKQLIQKVKEKGVQITEIREVPCG